MACNSRGYQAFGLEVKIDYVKATRPGDRLTAEAKPVHIGKRVSLWNMEIRNGSGDIVRQPGLATISFDGPPVTLILCS